MDWGMVTRLDTNLQLTLIEHMAHLTSADYAELPRDLLLLGFVPEEKANVIGDSGVVEVLSDIYGAWTAGGGAAAMNVNQVIAQLQDLTAQKGSLFRIPPYFAYIAKSFSVLEGIGLSNDANYSIINECLPYISKRLLTDKDKMGPALSTFIFGPDKSNSDRIVNYRRV
jgi:predicted unusual protein kinase regulating ubiquinone biosynthesis (AarF/ABC1/UbiB family)